LGAFHDFTRDCTTVTLISEILKNFKGKKHSLKLKDFLLAVLVLALTGQGFWMLRIMEELIKLAAKP
jgi:hypothetical protein